MSILETSLIFGVIPIAIVGIIGALSYLADRQPGLTIRSYTLSEKWTHAPILWSATDETTPYGGHGDTHASIESIGGSASGKW